MKLILLVILIVLPGCSYYLPTLVECRFYRDNNTSDIFYLTGYLVKEDDHTYTIDFSDEMRYKHTVDDPEDFKRTEIEKEFCHKLINDEDN